VLQIDDPLFRSVSPVHVRAQSRIERGSGRGRFWGRSWFARGRGARLQDEGLPFGDAEFEQQRRETDDVDRGPDQSVQIGMLFGGEPFVAATGPPFVEDAVLANFRRAPGAKFQMGLREHRDSWLSAEQLGEARIVGRIEDGTEGPTEFPGRGPGTLAQE
jgi:hypothetical protein